MKALTCHRYGPPESLTLADLPDPVPGPGEVLLRLRAATVSAADWRLATGTFPRGFGAVARLAVGLRGPRQKILGTDGAGEIAALGPGVTGWQTGEPVIATFGFAMRGHATLRVVPARALVRKPAGLTWEEATALPFGGLTALHYLRKTAVGSGTRVLVVGASGAVGSATVQIAQAMGAEVTGVTSGANLALVERLGARAIDYRTTDWTAGGGRWDVILDTAGSPAIGRARQVLAPGGRIGLIVADLWQTLAAAGKRDMVAGPAPDRPDDLAHLAGLAERGDYRPVISRTFALADGAAAFAHVATGRKVGNIALVMP
jgi:NADPH:quinone reductase-like Zn-dependent oxidoreductase